MRTQVAIVGAGPAGLLLSNLLQRSGIDSVVLEARSRSHVENRVRAGVLEHRTVDVLSSVGLGDRLKAEGLIHSGFEVRWEEGSLRVALDKLTDGKGITIYGQEEIVRDMIAARLAAGGILLFDVSEVRLHDIETSNPYVTFSSDGQLETLHCDLVVGCDGFRGVSRASIPADKLSTYTHEYPFAWLGILVGAPPLSDELIYAHHHRGFALSSMRTRNISRYHIQVGTSEDISAWDDGRIWKELKIRLGIDGGLPREEGAVLQKGITRLRSFVSETMVYGRLVLAGDAAHIVPPTGAKGMNLAMADVVDLSVAVSRFYSGEGHEVFNEYERACLKRVWRAQEFADYMTRLLHTWPGQDHIQFRLQHSRLEYLATSAAAATSVAENYVGYR